MKIPDNDKIMSFIGKYGITVVLFLVIVLGARKLVLSSIRHVQETKNVSCNLRGMEANDTISYKGKVFTVESADYTEYEYIGDSVYIRLKEIKN